MFYDLVVAAAYQVLKFIMQPYKDGAADDMLGIAIFSALSTIFMVIIILFFILMAAFLTLYERQTLAAIQRRKGPNVIGFIGLLQAFADAFKLLFKEQSSPLSSSRLFFIGSSLYIVLFSLFV